MGMERPSDVSEDVWRAHVNWVSEIKQKQLEREGSGVIASNAGIVIEPLIIPVSTPTAQQEQQSVSWTEAAHNLPA